MEREENVFTMPENDYGFICYSSYGEIQMCDNELKAIMEELVKSDVIFDCKEL